MTDTDGDAGPLAGVRVVELGVWVAGPGAAGILADWGADVVKIEPPAGDPARTFQQLIGGDVNAVFELDNRGKRSVALDLATDRGVELAHELLAGADVFVTNIRPDALDRLGLGPDAARARNPGLIYAIITGFGLDGPDAGRAAYDIAAFWARAGIAESLRQPGGPLPFQRGGMGDHSAAMTGAAMVSAALVGRARTGRGRLVSTSLLRQGAYTIGFDVNVSLMLGRTIAVGTRETMYSPTVNNYTAGDGRPFWIVGLEGERHWPALARAVGHPEWIEDERFADPRSRAINAADLIADLDRVFATRPLDEWAAAFDAEPDVFWSPVNSIDDLLADPQFHASGAVVGVPDEDGGRAMLATPADFDGARRRPAGGRPATASTPARCSPSSASTRRRSTTSSPPASRWRRRSTPKSSRRPSTRSPGGAHGAPGGGTTVDQVVGHVAVDAAEAAGAAPRCPPPGSRCRGRRVSLTRRPTRRRERRVPPERQGG